MASKKGSAGRILEVLSSGRGSLRGRDERIVVRVHVDPTCPADVARAVKSALVPVRSGAVVEVVGLDEPVEGLEAPDVVLVLVGEGDCRPLVSAYARSGVGVAMVVEGALDAPRVELPGQAEGLVGIVASSDPVALPGQLAAWLASATDKRLALAAGFPFCRRAVADALVSRCALENAVVGAVTLIPGSDFPVMTANQAKLALDLAAAYGRDIEPARAAELAAVLAGGLAWRGVARALLGTIPGVGALLKAGVGYGGTMATGNALRLRLELEDAAASAPESAPREKTAPEGRVQLGPAQDGDGYVTVGGGVR